MRSWRLEMRATSVVALVLVLALVLAGCQAARPARSPATPGESPVVTARPTTPKMDAPPTAAPATPEADASFSTDRIAFQRSGDRAGIYTIDASGTNEQRVLAGTYGTPKWSPDGTWLAVYHEKPDGSVAPALVRPDGSGYRELPLTPGLSCGLAAWSPDGGTLALECWDEEDATRQGIYLMSAADGQGLHQLTHIHGLPGQFSADGRRLLLAIDAGNATLKLGMVDVDGSNPQTVGAVTIKQMPGFLDGDRSIYAVVNGAIEILDLSGRRLRTIDAPEPRIIEARLSPDAKEFAFIYDPLAAVAPGLYRMAVDGSGLARIVHTNAPGIQEEHPDWAP
jgi:Tol biopolymer transport system component